VQVTFMLATTKPRFDAGPHVGPVFGTAPCAAADLRPSQLVGLCYSRLRKSVSWSRSTGCRQVRQRPAQQRRTGCRSSTACGSVRPAAGLLGRAVRA
jgi:hypothetical protein